MNTVPGDDKRDVEGVADQREGVGVADQREGVGVADQREGVGVADERTTLVAFLDRQRACVVAKVAGLDDAVVRAPGVESGTSIMGLVKHLGWVEHGWFELLVAQGSGTNLRPHDRGWEFTPQPGETMAETVDAYRRACARSREIVTKHDLDDTVRHDQDGLVTIRWIVVHMIEETARHLGHIDILVEQLDGRTGMG